MSIATERDACPSPASGRRVLRCDECGAERVCPTAELLRHTRDGWPKCCRLVMALFTDTDKPDDTGAEIPPLPTQG